MAPLNILSLNVQGINTPQKRTKAFSSFQAKKAHIICLQETHFAVNSTPKYMSPFYPQVFTASASAKKRGTLIAFHRSTPFLIQSEIKDPEGRYLIITGHIMDNAVTIVSYYAPNKQPTPFFSHLLQVVNTHKLGTVIIFGDSNQVLLPFLDKSPYIPSRNSSNHSFSKLLSRYNLVDSWRECNPSKRCFTYYSHPHKISTRIDHIFLTTAMVPEILTSSIIPIPWSDHNAIYTTISSTIPKAHDSTWYLPDIILKNPLHSQIIEQGIKDYLEFNTNPEVSPLTLWEAHKPVMRGLIQRQMALIKRERISLARKLESNFNTAFASFQSNPSSKSKEQLEKARLEYDLFLTESADKTLRRSKHMFYMKSNKPNTLLARTL